MKIQKQALATLKGCYSCSSIELNGRTNILLASEGGKRLSGVERS